MPRPSHVPPTAHAALQRTRAAVALGLLALAAVCRAPAAAAQDAPDAAPRAAVDARSRGESVADTLLREALERARAGDTTAALRLLDRTTAVAPRDPRPYFQRGVLLSRGTSFGLTSLPRVREAAGALNHALDLDPGNPRYLLELGRLRLSNPFLRFDAERLFNRALRAAESRHDPRVLGEVHAELGVIYEHRYLTTADRNLVAGATFDPDLARADAHYVRDFLEQRAQPLRDAGELDFRKAEDHYRAALLADSSSAVAADGLFGLLAQAGRWEELLHAAERLRAAQPGSARRLLARGLALHRLDRDPEAEPAFDSARALIPAAARREMTGLVTILTREHAAEYAALDDSARQRTDSLYWMVADPLALSAVNEARTEFLARVAYADLRFSSAEFHHPGWQTDRGQVYIRYGPPTRVASFVGGDASSGTDDVRLDPMAPVARITTLWWYEPTNMRFVFVGPPALAVATFAGDFRSYTEDQRDAHPVLFDNVARALHIDTVGVQVARFRAAGPPSASGAVDVQVYADLPTGAMLHDVEVTRSPLETGFFLTDGSRRALTTRRDSAVVPAGKAARDVTPRSWHAVLAPGDYMFRVEARESASGHAARAQGSLPVLPFPIGELSLSDILLAHRVVPRDERATPRSLADFDVTPNGSLTYRRGDTLHLYWEQYGLARDPATGAGRMRVALTLRLDAIDRAHRPLVARVLGGAADRVGLTPEGDDRVSLRFERTVPVDDADRVPSYLALDLGEAIYGTYTLEISVTDLVSGRTARQQRVFKLPRP